MKKTLALLIAVLMVVAMLPLSALTAAAEEPAQEIFAVYDADDAPVGNYATLAEADAALANGYTLKLLQDYTTDTPYVWGAARAEATEPISFTVDGNGCYVNYEGTGVAWTFGTNCKNNQIVIKDIYVVAMNDAVVVEVTDGVVMNLTGCYMASAGRAVVRTMKGSSADAPATLNIADVQFILLPTEAAQATDAVVTNGDCGNVYVNGGLFLNMSDVANGTARSEYVFRHTNAAGDFKIYGAIMMGSGVQKGFFLPANTANTTGVALPSMELPIIKGETPKIAMDENVEFYYTAYGAGDLLLTPTLAAGARVEIDEDGTNLVFVSTVSADMVAAIKTWARSKAYAAGEANLNNYQVDFGTLITSEEIFLGAGGSVDGLIAMQEAYGSYADLYTICVADEADIIETDDGLEILARVEDVLPEDKNDGYVAIPFIELTIGAGETERWYGEFNMTTGIVTMAKAATDALRNTTGEVAGDYLYESIMMNNAFSRYTVEEQMVLMEYLAHEHSFNFCGECLDEDCDENVCITLEEELGELFYTDNGTKAFYELELTGGVRYALGFTADLVNYQLYDEEGNLCTVNNGIFAPEADGTYYLNLTGKKAGSAEVYFSHIHDVDYLGDCAVCEVNVAGDATVGASNSWVGVKGNTYVLRVELEAGVAYAMRSVNGSFALYNEEGELQTVTDNVYVCPEEGTGTYYIMVQANYTGKLELQIAHIHTYDYTGLCAHCGDYLGVTLNNVYVSSTSQRVEMGQKLYFNIRLEAGKNYKIVSANYVGLYDLYDAQGNKMTLTGGTAFACAEDGVYYLVVTAQNKTNASIYFQVDHGTECTFDNTGACFFEHKNYNNETVTVTCGKTVRTRIEDESTKIVTVKAASKGYYYLNYLSANVTYKIVIEGAIDYSFYKADGTALTVDAVTVDNVTTVTYTPSADSDVYLVLENTGDVGASVSIKVSHEHKIDHRGLCTVKNTTTGKTPSACKEKRNTTAYADTAVVLNYTASGVYYYTVAMASGVEYTVNFKNADVAWELKDVNGTTLYSSADADDPFIPTTMDTYYLLVTANADSTGTPEDPATLVIASHTHSFNNKGECVGEHCGETFNKKVLEVGETYGGYLAAGKHFFHVTMEAGYTYSIDFTADGITYVLYGGENADQAMTLVDGAFACTESGTYYFVVTVAEDVPATETYEVVAELTEVSE